MSYLGPPKRGNEPLQVWLMALALVLAAIVGAGIGFVFDFGGSDEPATASAAEGS